MKVTALAGGVGAAKLLVGLARSLPGDQLTAVVNTGDDAEIYGVHVSPDVDIVTYWLAGMADTERGWGISGDTFRVIDHLAHLGHESWFRLGDRDFGTCLYRTQRQTQGATLTEIAHEIATALDVSVRIRPMSDDRVRTIIVTEDGSELNFQDYFVKQRTEPEVAEVRFEGAGEANPAPGVLDAIAAADRVLICPSNPILSIGPILALPGVRPSLRTHTDVVAISPIVRGAALKGPADRLLRSLHGASDAATVAQMYADFCETFVIDVQDQDQVGKIEAVGTAPVMLPTIMKDHAAAEALARELLSL